MTSTSALNQGQLDEVIAEIQSGNSEATEQLRHYKNFDVNQFLDGSTLLCHAAEHGYTQVLQELLKFPKIKINQQSPITEETPLYIAVKNRHLDIVKILLANRLVDVNQENVRKRTPLHEAVQINELEIVQELMRNSNIDPNKQDDQKDTPLILAIQENSNIEIIRELLNQPKIDVNIGDNDGCTPLHLAIWNQNVDIVNELLQEPNNNRPPIDVNKQRNNGATPLFTAALVEDLQIIKELRKFSTNQTIIEVNQAGPGGFTALMVAVARSNLEIVQELLQFLDIDVNLQEDTKKHTALHIAIDQGDLQIAFELLGVDGINVNMETSLGFTPLHLAACRGHLGVVQALLNRSEIEVNKQDKDECTPLQIAIRNDKLEIVQKLLEKEQVDVNIADKYQLTPLFAAIKVGNIEIIKELLKNPAILVNKQFIDITPLHAATNNLQILEELLRQPTINVNAVSQQKKTPLHHAAIENNLQTVRKLLQHPDIDPNIQTTDGFTALESAATCGHVEIVRELQNFVRTNLSAPSNINEKLLHAAAFGGNLKLVQQTLKKPGIDVNNNIAGGFFGTPLQIAAYRGHTNVVRELLKVNGIDANKATEEGFTALTLAAKQGHVEVVKLFLNKTNKQRHKIDVNQAELGGFTALYWAASNGSTEIVKHLLECPEINVNIATEENAFTPLHKAVWEGHLEVVRLLLKVPNIDVNCQVKEHRYTPLMQACLKGYVEITKILLDHPDIQVNHQCQHSAFNNPTTLIHISGYSQYFLQDQFEEYEFFAEGKGILQGTTIENTQENSLIQLLRIHDVKIQYKTEDGSTCQLRPTVPVYCQIMQLLLSHKNIDVDFCDEQEKTALLHACKYGHAKFVKLLLEKGANINPIIQQNFYHEHNNFQFVYPNEQTSSSSNELNDFIRQRYNHLFDDLQIATSNALFECLQTEIEFYEKLEVLFSRLDLEVNQKITIQVTVDNQEIFVNGNIIVASIMRNFDEDNADQLWQIFRAASKSIYTFDITLEILNTNLSGYPFTNILELLVFHEKFNLVLTLYQGFLDGLIEIRQLKYFISAFPKMLQKSRFLPIITSFVESEAIVMQRLSEENPSALQQIDLGTPIVPYLRSLITNASQYNVFQSVFIRAAIDEHWTKYTKWYYRVLLINFLLYLFFFIFSISVHIRQVIQDYEDEFANDSTIRIISWLSFPFVVVMFLTEILQLDYSFFSNNDSITQNNSLFNRSTGLLRKIFQSQVIIDLLDWFIICVGFSLPICWSTKNDSLMSLTAVFVMVLFLRLTIWLLPSKLFGHYILMIFLIAFKTAAFLIILFAMISFFTLSFTLIFQQLEETNEFDNQQFQVALGLFGNVELDDFYSPKSPYKETGLVLLAIFILVVPVLLINLQIALMTSIYEKVKEQRDAAFFRNKTLMVLESIRVFENIGRFIPCFGVMLNSTSIVRLKPELGFGGVGSSQLQNIEDQLRRIEEQQASLFTEMRQIQETTRLQQ